MGVLIVFDTKSFGDRCQSHRHFESFDPLPTGSLRIRLPDKIKPGIYFLRALNVHGWDVARSADFEIV